MGRMWKDNGRSIKERKIKMDDRMSIKSCSRQVKGKSKVKVEKIRSESWTPYFNNYDIEIKRTTTMYGDKTEQ